MRSPQTNAARITEQAPSLLLGLCAFAIVCSLVLGGGTRGGFLSDAILQLLTIPLLLIALWRLVDLRFDKMGQKGQVRWALAFCLAMVMVPLLQLVPLPPWLWTMLPNRTPEAAVVDLLVGELPWMPISVSPTATWLSALSLLPPLAIFLSVLLLGHRERRRLSLVILSVGLVSVFLGLLQVSQGPSSPLRFFEFTNPTEAVGFFANRNHLAALLYSLTLLAAAWAIDSAFSAGSWWDRNRHETASIVPIVTTFTILVILVSSQAIARSRAGLGLTILAVLGAFALAYSDRRAIAGSSGRQRSGVTPAKLLLGATTLAIMFAVQFTLYRVMERYVAIDPIEDSRILFARNTIEAARAYMPFGSGMGTFVPVYAVYEKPKDAMTNAYANHAHDDLLEVWLEGGVGGLLLMGVFVIWLVLRSVKIWRRAPLGAREIDHSLARAATLIVGLLVAHSCVDYPLRTGAMMAIMAFACALLVDSPVGVENTLRAEPENTGQRMIRMRAQQEALSAAPPARPRPQPALSRPAAGAIVQPLQPVELWGKDVDWPEEWRKPAKQSFQRTKARPNSDKPPND